MRGGGGGSMMEPTKMQWVKEISPEMLPEPYQKLTSLIGIDNALKLAREFQGTCVYFAKLDNILRLIRDKQIRREFSGGNHKQLAVKYGLTETWIRRILAERPREHGQISLFDFESSFGK